MAERIFLRATGLALIDGLLFGSAWSGPLTYSFPDAPSDYALPYSALSEPSSSAFAAVTATQRQAVRFILEGISPDGGGPVMRYGSFAAVSGVNLACAGFDDADIRIAATGAGGSTAHAYLPSLAPAGGDVWFSAYGGYGSPVLGDYAYLTHIHELGHSLGLKHSFEYGGPGFAVVPLARDSLEFTVMSYRSYVGAGINSGYTNETFGYPQTPMMLDIITLQYMYGANFATHAEDTSYRWNPMTGEMFVNGFGQGMPGANRVFLTIWDGGGFDTYDLSDYYTPTAIDLNPGNWSITAQAQRANLNAYGSGGPVYAVGNVFNALQYGGDAHSLIENAIGSWSDDTINGNAITNVLIGGAGNDNMFGNGGDDQLFGWSGDDLLRGGSGDRERGK